METKELQSQAPRGWWTSSAVAASSAGTACSSTYRLYASAPVDSTARLASGNNVWLTGGQGEAIAGNKVWRRRLSRSKSLQGRRETWTESRRGSTGTKSRGWRKSEGWKSEQIIIRAADQHFRFRNLQQVEKTDSRHDLEVVKIFVLEKNAAELLRRLNVEWNLQIFLFRSKKNGEGWS